MAASWLYPIKIRVGKSASAIVTKATNYSTNPAKIRNKTAEEAIQDAIFGCTDYSKNSNKTDGGELVKGYACNPRTVAEEFLLAKKEYEYLTGRTKV